MGQTNLSAAPIDESVGLLNKLNGTALEGFKKSHPNYKSILELGVIGGEKEVDVNELKVRVELCMLAIEETLAQTKNTFLPALRKKLRFLQKIELISQIIVVVSSSTVFGVLTQDLEKVGFRYTAYLASFLSLAGAILTIILKQNSGEWTMNNKNIATSYSKLVNLRIESEEVLRELNIKSQFIENNIDELKALINKCNGVNKDIRLIIDTIVS